VTDRATAGSGGALTLGSRFGARLGNLTGHRRVRNSRLKRLRFPGAG
jgi:hypothetical protein